MDTNTIVKSANEALSKLGLAPSQITKEIAAGYGITGTGTDPGRNDALDAFRHAYASAVATYLMGEGLAKGVGDYNEDRLINNPPKERNMDLWNNDIGREIGKTSGSIAEIGQRVAEAIRQGRTINGLDDTTKTWTEPTQQPSISIPDILTHPLGRILLFLPVPPAFIGMLGIEILRELYKSAIGTAAPVIRYDPLILDLDGDGVETTNVKDGAYFDHDGNGFAEQTGWAGADDGLLVMDRNNDGIINDGKELFGDQTLLANGTKAANGFEALKQLDSNNDNKIDSADTAFNQLKVWQDTDGDGYSTADELKSLSDVGITAINLTSTPSTTTDPEGNTQTRTGSFEKTDGTSGSIAEYTLRRDTTYTIANEWLDVPEDIAALPDLQGYGNVYDLQQAIVRDTSGQLKTLVEQFSAANDTNTRNSLMEQILYKWTGSDTIDPASRGTNIDARKLAVLEKFFGQAFVSQNGSNPIYESAILLNEAYRGLSEMMYSQLMAQTHLKPLYDKISYTWDDATQSVKGDMSSVITELQNQLSADSEHGKTLLGEFSRTIRGFGAQDMMNYLNFRETFISIDPSFGWIIDSAGLPVVSRVYVHTWGTDNSEAIIKNPLAVDNIINGFGNKETFRLAA